MTTPMTIVIKERMLKSFILLAEEYDLSPTSVKFCEWSGEVYISIEDEYLYVKEVFDRTIGVI